MSKEFKGGIKAGTTAYDEQSSKLDGDVRAVRDTLAKEFENHNSISLVKRKTFEKGVSMQPDGGVWYVNDKLVAVFEAKKQGKNGNAHERWFKNSAVAFKNDSPLYVTFCTGAGVRKNKPLDKLQKTAKFVYGDKAKFYSKEEGFSYDEIYHIMKETILSHIV